MPSEDNVDYGPLTSLIGEWAGNKGIDWAPEKSGLEKNLFHETIVFTAAGLVENAESQALAVLHYHQVVIDSEDDEPIHNQTGYLSWEAETKTVMHSFTIPRGVCVIAGGVYNGPDESGKVSINLKAELGDKDWGILQSPFMSSKAKTTEFTQTLTVDKSIFCYDQTTVVEIYGKVFNHTDQNSLSKI
ncbi:MAG: heme-binding beta-barrel domain-containing protein [Lentisphaeraceae bacterium]|nr:heme-binding beta-barrel domain-containing protein [Lentisphaeraceae bacterium]